MPEQHHDHAIVIGIDRYKNRKWRLSAAVRDAVGFARWVTKAGGGRATKETLTLLLSPEDGQGPTDLAWDPATRDVIHDVLDRYARKEAAGEAPRLWFFYAGHGVMPPGEGPDTPPVLVPADVDDIDDYLFDNKLELKKYLGPLQLAKPKEQIYFIDACRRIVQPEDNFTATTQIYFDLSKLLKDKKAISCQVLLLATTAGQLANELGLHGIFGQALMEGLQGRGPELVASSAREELILTFDSLAKYTKIRVRHLGSRPDKQLPTQEPWSTFLGAPGDLALAHFDPEKVPSADLSLYIEPPVARPSGVASLRVYRKNKCRYMDDEVQGPPLPEPVTWSLPYSTHLIQVKAPGFKKTRVTIQLLDDEARPIVLEPDTSATPSTVPAPAPPPPRPTSRPTPRMRTCGPSWGGSEFIGDLLGSILGSRGGDLLRRIPVPLPTRRRRRTRPAPPRRPPPEPDTGTLKVSGQDRWARIEVFDAEEVRVAAGWGEVVLEETPAAPYRVEISLPGEPPHSQKVFIMGDETTEVDPGPVPPIPRRLLEPLDHLDFQPTGHQSQPSELFGPHVTTTRIGSVLAWSAYASRFPYSNYGYKLKQVGIDPRTAHSNTDCLVQVLIGDVAAAADDAPFPLEWEVSLGPPGAGLAIPIEAVSGLPGLAGQWTGLLVGRDTHLQIAGPGLAPKSLALPHLPGYVVVVIVAREASGGIEIHRYLNPIDPLDQGYEEFSDDIRRTERNWRALQRRVPLLPAEAEELLTRTALDPLTLAVLGYRLHRENRLDLFMTPGAEHPSAWARLKERAPALPDLHILAALAVGSENGNAYNRYLEAAAASGIPPVADGYEILSSWLVMRSIQDNLPPPIAIRPFTPGGAWTVFDARDTRTVAAGTRTIPVSRLTGSGTPWAERIRPAVEATGKIEHPSSPGPFMATGFLVTPTLLATMEFCISSLASHLPPDGGQAFTTATAVFDEARIQIGSFSRVLAHSRVGPKAGNAFHPVALVELGGVEAQLPAPLAWSAPRMGQRIAVIGHPMFDGRIPQGMIETLFTAVPAGEKTVMPGSVVAVTETYFVYECWTMGGAAGGSVVDLDTGEVCGIHYGGKFDSATGVKYGMGFALSLLADDPMWALAGIVPEPPPDG